MSTYTANSFLPSEKVFLQTGWWSNGGWNRGASLFLDNLDRLLREEALENEVTAVELPIGKDFEIEG